MTLSLFLNILYTQNAIPSKSATGITIIKIGKLPVPLIPKIKITSPPVILKNSKEVKKFL